MFFLLLLLCSICLLHLTPAVVMPHQPWVYSQFTTNSSQKDSEHVWVGVSAWETVGEELRYLDFKFMLRHFGFFMACRQREFVWGCGGVNACECCHWSERTARQDTGVTTLQPLPGFSTTYRSMENIRAQCIFCIKSAYQTNIPKYLICAFCPDFRYSLWQSEINYDFICLYYFLLII